MEQWRDIPGFEDCYQVSDMGRVRSLDRYVRTFSRFELSTRLLKGRVLKIQKHNGGYAQVCLSRVPRLIHSLVLLAFVGPVPEGMEGAHDDGDRTNNRLSNLRYATPLSNANDRRLHGTSGAGAANTMAKLSLKDIATIRGLAGTLSQKVIGERFGIRQGTVSRILAGKRW